MRYYTFTESIKRFIDKLKYHNKTLEILSDNCYVTDSGTVKDDRKVYRSRIDESYIGHIGMEDDLYFMAKYNIDSEIQNSRNNSSCAANIGFSSKKEKWYGWSHRAICGFGIGSKVKKGDVIYKPLNKEDMKEEMIRFWLNTHDDKLESIEETEETCRFCKGKGCEFCNDTGKSPGLRIIYSTSKDLRFECFEPYPKEWGKGEWIARTLDDAKQMAIDFAKEVS